MIKLFHGSNVVVDNISFDLCKPYKDFGKAFYLTADLAQAQIIADSRVSIYGGEPVVNEYEFDETRLLDGSLDYKSFDSYDEEWAQFIFQHRDEKQNPPYMHNYDVVYGPIADDRVGMQIRNYREGYIELEEMLRRLKYMKGITFQYAFCTTSALSYLKKI